MRIHKLNGDTRQRYQNRCKATCDPKLKEQYNWSRHHNLGCFSPVLPLPLSCFSLSYHQESLPHPSPQSPSPAVRSPPSRTEGAFPEWCGRVIHGALNSCWSLLFSLVHLASRGFARRTSEAAWGDTLSLLLWKSEHWNWGRIMPRGMGSAIQWMFVSPHNLYMASYASMWSYLEVWLWGSD